MKRIWQLSRVEYAHLSYHAKCNYLSYIYSERMNSELTLEKNLTKIVTSESPDAP